MLKIAHIADVHIRNLKYHDVYENVFDQLYTDLRKEKPDYIVVAGDVAHTKTQISPEYIDMATRFLQTLADITKTIVIPGNHDGLLRTPSRMDSITPVVNNIDNDNLFYSRDANIFRFPDIDFYHLSIFDEDNWPSIIDDKKLNAAIYHGCVSNSVTDIGHVLEHGDLELEELVKYDYALLGDIHKTNQTLDKLGKVRYPGSLITQNFGETNDKGYLIWEIKDKKDYDCRHVQLTNPKPFVTISLTPKGRIPYKISVPSNARLRLVSDYHISLDVMRKAMDVAKRKFKPQSVSFLNRATKKGRIQVNIDDEFSKKNLRDTKVQEELIKEYLVDYDIEKDISKDIVKINSKINSEVLSEEEMVRNVHWSVEDLEWDNLFNYGKGNKVDFSSLNGLVGIFGKSYSGKSSIIDSLMYTLFNSTSKNVRKNCDMINQHKDNSRGRVVFKIDNEKYIVERTSEKYKKKLHGEVTQEARTDVSFVKVVNGEEESLNGLTRRDTDNKIRSVIGTLDDFLVTSFSAQFGSLTFIDQRSTERKKTLAKFLDLDFFEKKFKVANEHSSDLKGALKMLESVDYEAKLEELTEEKKNVYDKLNKYTKEVKLLEREVQNKNTELLDLTAFVSSVPQELEDISGLVKDLKEFRQELRTDELLLKGYEEQLEANEENLSELEEKIENISYENLIKDKDLLNRLQEQIEEKFDDLIRYENTIDRIEDAERHLKEAPCNSEYSSCSLVESAYQTLQDIGNVEKIRDKYDKINSEYTAHVKKVENIDSEHIESQLETLETMKKYHTKVKEHTIPLLSSKISECKGRIKFSNVKIHELESKKEVYDENIGKINTLEEKKVQQAEVITQIKELKKTLSATKNNLSEMYAKRGYFDQKLENVIEERQKLEQQRKEYTAYDLYKRCMHSNGIPFDIIKKRLPAINQEISKILANVVEFEVFFESSDNKLEIFIKHPKHNPRLIETGSGAEKTLAATAIRLALLSVSTMPKGDLFILDEPATELDEETKDGFIRILEMIKSYFSKVILISHLDPFKDVVDTQITIEKKNGYAHVQV